MPTCRSFSSKRTYRRVVGNRPSLVTARFGWLACCLVLLGTASHKLQANDQSTALQALARGEAVALLRHALAPGMGDPDNFLVGDCSTQRNLSTEGRLQARAIGDRFRQEGIAMAEVFTSAWCRCQDTARLLSYNKPEVLPALNSFFGDRTTADAQTSELRDWISQRLRKQNATEAASKRPATLLVTHQVNITALTGVYPASGDSVIVSVRGDELVVLGQLAGDPASQ